MTKLLFLLACCAVADERADLLRIAAETEVIARAGCVVASTPTEADELIERLDHEGRNPKSAIHLPAPSYFPFIMAMGLPLIAYGIIYHTSIVGKALLVIGPLITIGALIGWGIEPLEEPEDEDGFEDSDGCPDPDNDQDLHLVDTDGQDLVCHQHWDCHYNNPAPVFCRDTF